jgi:hypothetical protein
MPTTTLIRKKLQNNFHQPAHNNGDETMKQTTFSINSLASSFEVDRQTLVRALVGKVEPDFEKIPGRPEWKISTASNALAAHRARNPRADGRRQQFNGNADAISDWQDPLLVQLFAAEDQGLANMRAQPTLEDRRTAAIAMKPLLARVYAAIGERGRANGQDADATDYRADHLYLIGLRNFEQPCEWSESETRQQMALS